MSLYTGIRFKGVVNKDYRSTFKDIALYGIWEIYDFEPFTSFWRDNDRHAAIRIKGAPFLWSKWEKCDDFKEGWDTESGYWSFQTMVNHGEELIDDFMNLLPELMESVEYLEILCECEDRSSIYKMQDGKLIHCGYKNY